MDSGNEGVTNIWLNTENWLNLPNYTLEIAEILFYKLFNFNYSEKIIGIIYIISRHWGMKKASNLSLPTTISPHIILWNYIFKKTY